MKKILFLTLAILAFNVHLNAQTIETQIDGEFEGWEGETIFKMINGQIWQQSSYAYLYHYAYYPKVIIYKKSSGYVMKVEGVEQTINVVQINSSNSHYQSESNQYSEVIRLLRGASIIAQDDDRTFLGTLTNGINSNSIFNKMGTYGSYISSNSIWNKMGTYGSSISDFSPFNIITSTPPMIVKNENIIGYLTVNEIIYGGISPDILKALEDKF